MTQQGWDLNKAEVFSTTPKFEAGDFSVVIEKIKLESSRRFPSKMYFVVEFEVAESSVDSISEGSKRSWAVDMSYPNSPGNVKEFFAAAIGIDPNNETQLASSTMSDGRTIDWNGLQNWAIGAENPLRGRKLYLATHKTITRNNREFMLHRWEPGDQGPIQWVRLVG